MYETKMCDKCKKTVPFAFTFKVLFEEKNIYVCENCYMIITYPKNFFNI